MSVVSLAPFADSYRESLCQSSECIARNKLAEYSNEEQRHMCLLMAYDFLCRLDKLSTITYFHRLIRIDSSITQSVLGISPDEQDSIIKEAYDEWVRHIEQLNIQLLLPHIPLAIKLSADLLSAKKDYELLVCYDMPLHTLKTMRTIAQFIQMERIN